MQKRPKQVFFIDFLHLWPYCPMDMIYNASFAGLDWVQNAMHVLVKIHSMRLCSAHHKWVFIIVFRNVEKLLCWGHFSDCWCCGVHHESEAGAGVQEIMITWRHQSWACNDPSAKFSQSWRASLLGPSPGWKRILSLSHLRHYAKQTKNLC